MRVAKGSRPILAGTDARPMRPDTRSIGFLRGFYRNTRLVMGRSALVPIGICVGLIGIAGHPVVREKSPHSGTVVTTPAHVDNVLAKTPLSFEENRGQASSDVLYVARSPLYGVSLLRDRVTLSLPARARPRRTHVDRPTTDISIKLIGSQSPRRIEGLDTQKARSS